VPVSLPLEADTVVIGGGTAGSAVAGLLAGASDERVLVLESGPDFGPRDSSRWPADLLDARAIGYSHDWDYGSGETYAERVVRFERAKVIGGCSAHNGCAAIWGSRVDYDGWAERGLEGWSTDDLLPLFDRAATRLRVRNYGPDEITPFHQACLAAAARAGIPVDADLNDLDQDEGMAASPVNIVDGVRWNAAFAYLDPVRHRPNLTIAGGFTVDQLRIDSGRVSLLHAIGPAGPVAVRASRFVLAGGTYGTPAVLLRSGIGDPAALGQLGMDIVLPLPGVGANLHDHPAVELVFSGTPALEQAMAAFAATRWLPEEQTIAKVRSARYPAAAPGFDLHLYPVGGPDSSSDRGWSWRIPIACMNPRSRGAVTLRSGDPLREPRIDHRYISDPEGHDQAVLREGIRVAREMAAQSPLRELLGEETSPGSGLVEDGDLERWIESAIGHYYHPVGTCAMGVDGDPGAVTDARGRVRGLENVYVADCSVIPVIPRANTNVPAVVIGERIASWLLAG
jgi:choline dehydrogenase